MTAGPGHGLRQEAFLSAFRETGVIRYAAEAAQINRRTHYRWLEEDSQYVAAFEAAKEDAVERLEREALRRAVDGVPRVKFSSRTGKPLEDPWLCECGRPRYEHVRTPDGAWGSHPEAACPTFQGVPYVEYEYSDALLTTLLKAHAPDKYRERTEVSMTMASIQNLDMRLLPDGVIEAIACGEHPLAVLSAAIEGAGPDAERTRRALAAVSSNESEPVRGEVAQNPPPSSSPPPGPGDLCAPSE